MKSFVLVMLFLFPLMTYSKNKDVEAEQIKFLTDFYRGYMESKNSAKYMKETPFFSARFLKGLHELDEVCAKKRGDDICGFDGDIFYDAQEYSDKLKIESSGFKASVPLPNRVEVNFNIFPEQQDSEGFYDRRMIFELVKENSKWRVNDIFNLQDKKKMITKPSDIKAKSLFEEIRSMIDQFKDNPKDLALSWEWLTINLQNKHWERAAQQFALNTINICSENKTCKETRKDDKELQAIFEKITNAYVKGTGKDQTIHWPGPKDFGKKESKSPKQNQFAENGPFTFTFKNEAWWLTQIHLYKIKSN